MDGTLDEALAFIWPRDVPEALVKHTAAEFLLRQPSYTALAAQVGEHVNRTIGKPSTLGVSKGFQQMLREDPCFTVHTSGPATVTLNTTQVLSQFEWRRTEWQALQQKQQQQKQQQQQVQARSPVSSQAHAPVAAAGAGVGASSSGVGRSGSSSHHVMPSELRQGLDEVWPAQGPGATVESRAKRAALLALGDTRGKRCTSSGLALTVRKALGRSLKDLGCTKSFRQLLQEEPQVFVFEPGPTTHEALVSLNALGVLNKFVPHKAQLQQQPQQQLQPRAQQGMQPVPVQRTVHSPQQQQQWPQQVQVHSPLSPQAHSPVPPAAATGAGASSSSGGGGFKVRMTVKLQQGLDEVWPAQGPGATVASRAKRAALLHLVNTPEQRSTSSSLALSVNKTLGRSLKDLGCTKPFRQLLQEEPQVFVFEPGPAISEPLVSLNALGVSETFVRRLYHKTQQQQQQQQQQSPVRPAAAAAAGAGPSSSGAQVKGSAAPTDTSSASSSSSRSPAQQQVKNVPAAGATAATAVTSKATNSAEAAAAALQAAAKSLMPPPVRSPAKATPTWPADVDAAAVASNSSRGDGAAAALSTPAAAADMLAGAMTSPTAAAAAATLSVLPPWLQLCKANAPAATQQTAAEPVERLQGEHKQQVQPAVDMQAPEPGAAAAAAAEEEPAVPGLPQEQQQPLQYELQLSPAAPGWYTARYVPRSSTAANSAAGLDQAGAGVGKQAGVVVAEQAGDVVAKRAGDAAEPAAEALVTGDVDSLVEAATAEPPAQASELAAAEGSTAASSAAAAAAPGADEGQQGTGDGHETAGTAAGVGSGAAEAVLPAQEAEDAGASAQELPQDLLQLLKAVPVRLQPELLPYLSRSAGSPRVSHIIFSAGQPVTLRLDNSTGLRFTTPVTLTAALESLLAAQREWQQLQVQLEGAEGAEASAAEDSGSASVAAQGVQGETRQHSSSSSSSGSEVASNGAAQPSSSEEEGAHDMRDMNGGTAEQHSKELSGSSSKAAAALPPAAAPEAAAAAAQAAAQQQGSADLHTAARKLFGASGRLGIPHSCHHVAALWGPNGRVAGLTYCLEHHVPEAAAGLVDVLCLMKASLLAGAGADRPQSLLLLGRPERGPAGLLRDMCRLLSSNPEQGGLGLHVMLLDPTSRVAGCSSSPPGALVGSTRCLPVPDASQLSELMLQAARDHRPDCLVVSELCTHQDIQAALHISRSCNMLLLACVPTQGLQGLLQDSLLSPLVGCERLPVQQGWRAGSSSRTGSNRGLWGADSRLHKMQPVPFSMALEVLSPTRWRLHLDLQASVDDLVQQQAATDRSSSSSSWAWDQAPPPVSKFAQLRCSDGGQLVAEFTSGAAVRLAQQEQQLLESAAAAAATKSCE